MKSLAESKKISEKKNTHCWHTAQNFESEIHKWARECQHQFFSWLIFFLSFCVVEFAEKKGLIVVCCFQCGAANPFIISSFQVFLQLLILLTGNYNFFNLLTIVLCISLLDDKCILSRMQCFLCRRCMRSSCCHAASQRK